MTVTLYLDDSQPRVSKTGRPRHDPFRRIKPPANGVAYGGSRSSELCPKPEDIKSVRLAHGLTQRESAILVHATKVAWQSWECGRVRMHPGHWELFLLKVEFAADMKFPKPYLQMWGSKSKRIDLETGEVTDDRKLRCSIIGD